MILRSDLIKSPLTPSLNNALLREFAPPQPTETVSEAYTNE